MPNGNYDEGDRLVKLEVAQYFTANSLDKLAGKFELLERRFSSRPSWGIVLAFALLQACITVLLVALVARWGVS